MYCRKSFFYVLCCVVLCCVVLCCVVLCSRIVLGKRQLSRQILHYLKDFLCLKTCLLQCYELLRRRTNLDGCFIFVYFIRIVKTLGADFRFLLPQVFGKSTIFLGVGGSFVSACLYRSLSLSCTGHRPWPNVRGVSHEQICAAIPPQPLQKGPILENFYKKIWPFSRKKRSFFHLQVYNIYERFFTETEWRIKPPPKTVNTRIPSL